MTICVAAVGNNGMIFGASDRMKTGGDIEFEPRKVEAPQVPVPWIGGSKIFFQTTSLAAMTAGDSALQIEILQQVYQIIQARVRTDPSNWWRVEDFAELYVAQYDRAKFKRASSAVLAPLDLDAEKFIRNQATMSRDFVRDVTHDLQSFDMPVVETIFLGVDNEGSHIYTCALPLCNAASARLKRRIAKAIENCCIDV
jgi:hypothetical protein